MTQRMPLRGGIDVRQQGDISDRYTARADFVSTSGRGARFCQSPKGKCAAAGSTILMKCVPHGSIAEVIKCRDAKAAMAVIDGHFDCNATSIRD
jgi:hypothetical protein